MGWQWLTVVVIHSLMGACGYVCGLVALNTHIVGVHIIGEQPLLRGVEG